MSTAHEPETAFSFDRLIGMTHAEIVDCLGQPATSRKLGDDTWLVFRSAAFDVRVRCGGPAPARVASWTVTFRSGHTSLREAAVSVGLWPAAVPDQLAETCERPLLRRPLPAPGSDVLHTLTAPVRNGRITQLSAFDEPPDWL